MNVMFILYQHGDDAPMTTIVAALSEIPGVRVQELSPSHIRVWEDEGAVEVHLSGAPHVLAESREIAREFNSRQDSDRIATCDRRIEVSYQPDPASFLFNTWLSVIDKLRSVVDGIVYDADEGEFPYHADG